MKTSDIVLGVGAVLLGAMVVLYLQPRKEQPQAPELPAAVEPPPAAAPEPPPVHYPVAPAPEAEQQAPPEPSPAAPSLPPAASPATQPAPAETAPVLPVLDASDGPLKNDLGRVIGTQSLGVLFHTDGLIRRLVVSVDNLPGKQFPRSGYRLARSTPGLLVVDRAGEGDDERIYLSPRNFARYTPFVSAIEHLDIDGLVAIYRHYYPLVQQVYENLGYPASAYFNDRLVEVIDQLLDTPDIDRPVRLVQPHVLYKYADPQLEALSAGQKVLIRVGPDNAHKLKAKLRSLRAALVSLGAGG
ncbi:MAG: DUF3014 domain-containing protein [Thiogranum sp.]|jgi:hypothetical protein